MNRRTIFAYALGPIGGGVFSVISLPILTWLFSVEDIGRLAMLQVAVNFSTLLFGLGLDQAYVREYHETSNKAALFMMCAVPGLLLLMGAAVVLQLMNSDFLSGFLFGEHVAVVGYLTLLCLIASYISRFLSLILRMQNRAFAFSLTQLLSKALLLVIVIIYLLGAPHYTFAMLLIAQTTALMLTLAILGWSTRHDWRPALSASFDITRFKFLAQYAVPLFVAGLLSWGLNSLDKAFLRFFSNYEELGVYSVALNFAASVTMLSAIFNTIWAPFAFKLHAEGSGFEEIDSISDRLMAVIFLLICLAGGFSWTLRYLLPVNYYDVPSIVVGCMLPPLFYTLSEVTGIGIAITRNNIYAIAISLVSLVFCGVLGWLLIPSYGARGAMSAMVGAFWLFFALRTELSARLWMSKERKWLHARALLVAVYVIFYSFFDLYGLGDYAILFSFFIGGLGVYFQRRPLLDVMHMFWLKSNASESKKN